MTAFVKISLKKKASFLFAFFLVFLLVKTASAAIFVEDFGQSVVAPASSSSASGISLVMDGSSVAAPVSSTGNLQFSDSGTSTINALLEAKLIGIPLVYPNPFKFIDTPKIGYRLTAPMDVRIKFFDMYGHSLSTMDIAAGQEGGASGYNRVPLTLNELGGLDSSGIYFYVMFNASTGKIIGKGSFALKP